jgi:thymidylate synthase (FAD)
MSTVDIKIYNIARMQVDRVEVRRWLDDLGAEAYELPSWQDLSDPALLVALAAKRCYKSFVVGLNPNITKVRQDLADYLENLMKQGHGSVLEHAVYSFAIEGVSRVFTAEMNRHKAGWAISEGSLRYIRFGDDIPWWMPTSIEVREGDDEELQLLKARTRELFRQEFEHQQQTYAKLAALWDLSSSSKNFHYKKVVTSCLRRIIGMGVATGGVWTGNIRALRHVITMRTDPAAEEEIFHVFSRIVVMMQGYEPELFGDFTLNPEGAGYTPAYRKV